MRSQDLLGDHLRLVELATCNEHGGEVQLSIRIVGVQRDRFLELPERGFRIPRTYIGSSQLEVCGGKSGINFHGIPELDDGFLELALFEVLLAAVQVLELSYVGVPGTAGRKCQR